jgi:hypothetical protein
LNQCDTRDKYLHAGPADWPLHEVLLAGKPLPECIGTSRLQVGSCIGKVRLCTHCLIGDFDLHVSR